MKKINLFILSSILIIAPLTSCKTEDNVDKDKIFPVKDFELIGFDSNKPYTVGEIIDFTKMSLLVTRNDETTETIKAFSNDVTIKGASTEAPGSFTFEITFENKTNNYRYNVIQNYVTLDFNGGTFEGKKEIKLPLYNNQVDLSKYSPELTSDNEKTFKFSGWYYDKENTKRATYLIDKNFISYDNTTLYAGYDLDYSDEFIYSINEREGTCELISPNFDNPFNLVSTDTLYIPKTIEGYKVTSIADDFLVKKTIDETTGDVSFTDYAWFANYRKIVFPSDSYVETIGARCFKGVVTLVSIELPNSLLTIGKEAFSETKLEGTLTLPSSLRKIGESAFSYGTGNLLKVEFNENSAIKVIGENAFQNNLSLHEVELPQGLEEIREGAFSNCRDIINLNLPSSLSIVGVNAFKLMDGLKNINVDKDNPFFTSLDGNLFDKNMTKLIKYCYGENEKEYTLPKSTLYIDDSAFNVFDSFISLQKLNLNEGLIYIGSDAFNGCTFEFTIPSTLRNFAINAFNGYKGTSYKVYAKNKYYSSVDGLLCSKSGRTLYSVPGNYETKFFILNKNIEKIGEYAFFNNQKITFIRVPEDSKLSVIKKNAMILTSFKNLRLIEFKIEKMFTISRDSFINPNTTFHKSVIPIIFYDEYVKKAFEQKFYRNVEDTQSKENQTLLLMNDEIKENALKYLYKSTGLSTLEDYKKGIMPRLNKAINFGEDDFKLASALLMYMYLNGFCESDEILYYKLIEKNILSSLYYAEKENSNTINPFANYNFYHARTEVYPNEFKEDLLPLINKIDAYYKGFEVDLDINAISALIMDFDISQNNFNNEEAKKLLKRLEELRIESRSLGEQVYIRYNAIKASSLIYECLEHNKFNDDDMFFLESKIEDNSANNYYGIRSYLNGWFNNEFRQSILYKFDEFKTLLDEYDAKKETFKNNLINNVNNFDYSTFDEVKFNTFYYKYVNHLLSEHYYDLTNEERAICYMANLMININSFINDNEKIRDDNFTLKYEKINEIDNLLNEVSDNSNIDYEAIIESNFPTYITKKDEVINYKNTFVNELKNEIINFEINKENLKNKYNPLMGKIEKLGSFSSDFLRDDNDIYINKYFIIQASFIIYNLIENYPNKTKENYNEIRNYLYDYIDFDSCTFIKGKVGIINDFLTHLNNDTSSIYEYDKYVEYIDFIEQGLN